MNADDCGALRKLSKDTLISLFVVANRKAELWDKLVALLYEARLESEEDG